jgi:CubicO group peptidase (beta-lactamase class C family)
MIDNIPPDPAETGGEPASNEPAAELAAIIGREMRRSRVPGMSVAVTRRDRLLYATGFGHADIATRAPASALTTYLWFSCPRSPPRPWRLLWPMQVA